jgi:hypothetical protein
MSDADEKAVPDALAVNKEGVSDDEPVVAAQPANVVAIVAPERKMTRKEFRAARKALLGDAKENRERILGEHPEFVASAREAGLSDEKIVDWIRKLAPINIGDKELVKIGEPGADAPLPVSATRRQLTIWRHQISHWWIHGRGLQRLLYGGAWLSLLWGAVMKSGLSWWGYLAGLVVLGTKLKIVIRENDPRHMPLFHRTQNERSLLLKTLLEREQLWRTAKPSHDQIREFQVDALRAIALLVRDHRADLGGRCIFVKLIERAGDGVEVIARADDNRPVPTRYTKEQCSIAWAAFETGVPKVTGDLYSEAPKTTPGKTYNSVLALPVKLRDQVLAVVSIDSELKHHFYGHFDDLQTWLGPYVQLIASSRIEDHDTHQLPSSAEGE